MKNTLTILVIFFILTQTSTILAAPIMHVCDSLGNLVTVDIDTGVASLIGNNGIAMTDIAFDLNGDLYGITFNELYSINPTTADATLIGTVSNAGIDMNSLVFGSDGTLWAASIDRIITIDKNTASGTVLSMGNYLSSGDLAFDVSGDLFLTSGIFNDGILKIDQTTGAFTIIGATGFNDVYGFGRDSAGNMYGVTAGNSILSLDIVTGAGTYLGDITASSFTMGESYGASFVDEAVPEPATMLLLGLGTLAIRKRRVKNR